MGSLMMPTSRIEQLAQTIASAVRRIDEHNQSHSLPTQSFDPSAPFEYDYPAAIAAAKQEVLEATDELHALLIGPASAWIIPHHNFLVAQQAIYRFNIANSFPEGQERATFVELAQNCGLTEPQVRRIVRTAMASFIFREPQPGVVEHTAASKYFATTPVAQQWTGMMTEELWPAATKVVDAMSEWKSSEEPEHSGYNLAHSTNLPIFEYLADKPDRASRFAGAMSLLNTGDGYDPKHLVKNYPWASLGAGIVVDVGGSHGSVAISLAKAFPDMRCVVQDRAETIAKTAIPHDLEGRLSFEVHDFFKTQPIVGADVYFYRWILHDWSDKYCIKILRALIPALKPGAKVVLNEYILPEPGQVSRYVERTRRAFDIAMLEFQNAKEREVQDWIKLFADADPRFNVTMMKQPALANLGIIEATWCPL